MRFIVDVPTELAELFKEMCKAWRFETVEVSA